MAAIIEVFVDDSSLSSEVINKVRELSCAKCEVTVYNLKDPCSNSALEAKILTLGVTSIPAVVMNGQWIDIEKVMSEKRKH
ncbi:glutaredoxin [Paenibacillus sp. GCM10028914]|uniref:glutaredoxin n=1 Tax=Paenibacillus sp. GCM10028914 TaxID=3273416 RepID=UPI003616A1F4